MAKSPPLVVPNVIQIKLGWTIAGPGAFNVIHVRKGSAQTLDQTLANSIGSAVKGAYTGNLPALMTTNVALHRIYSRDLSAPNMPEFQDTGAAVGGTDAVSQPLPASVALCLTLRTAKAGRSFRGRFYLGGFSEAQNDTSGLALPAAAAAAVSFVEDMADALGALGLSLGVLSRPSNATTVLKRTGYPDGSQEEEVLWSSPQRAGGIEDVTLIASRTLAWETQRKRTNGRGGVPSFLGSVAQARIGRP